MRIIRFLTVAFIIIAPSILLSEPVGNVVKAFKISEHPTGLAWDGRNLWIADRDLDFIYAIDPKTGSVVDSVPCPAFFPTGLTYGDGCLWVADYFKEEIYKVDLKNRRVKAILSAPSSQTFGIQWKDGFLWAADQSKHALVKIETEDGIPMTQIKAPTPSPLGLASDGKYLWASDRHRDCIHMIDERLGWVIASIPSPGPYPWGIAYDGKYLWNVDYEKDSLYAINITPIRDEDLIVMKNPKAATVRFTCKVRCLGPDVLDKCHIYLAIPYDDLAHQRLLGKIEFNPENPEIVTDKWGQKFAHFEITNLSPGETRLVFYEVPVEIKSFARVIFPERVGKLSEIPKALVEKYTVDGSRLLISDPTIQNAISEAIGDEKNPYWIVRKIFEYVNSRIDYERAGGWDTAPNVLKRGTGSCSEYSFVFMAMARGAGIPTRFCAGVCERGDDASMDDVFHRWTEVYLPNYGWVPIDASAGDTEWQADAIRAIGTYQNRILITTIGGGDSEYMGWNYNYGIKIEYEGRTSLDVSAYADWEPRGNN